MGLTSSYWAHCDICGDSSDASKPTIEEAWDHVERGDWWTHRVYEAAVCNYCYDPDQIYHAQRSNVFCVLCESGDHIPIRK